VAYPRLGGQGGVLAESSTRKGVHASPAVRKEGGVIDGQLASIVWTSLKVSGAAVLMSASAGVPLGAWAGLARFPGKRVSQAAVYTGMAMPPVVVGLIVYLLLSRSGPLADLGWLFTPKAMILAQTLLALPFVVGIVMHATAAVPADLFFQARTLGATPWQARWTMLREARAGVVLAVAAAMGRSLSEVGAMLIVGGNIAGHTRVMTTAIVLETGKGHFALALALGGILLTIALALNVAIVRLQGRPAP
jgi:tungstate transport system permease protein